MFEIKDTTCSVNVCAILERFLWTILPLRALGNWVILPSHTWQGLHTVKYFFPGSKILSKNFLCLALWANLSNTFSTNLPKLLEIDCSQNKGGSPTPDMASLLNFIVFLKPKQKAMSCVWGKKIAQLHFIKKI